MKKLIEKFEKINGRMLSQHGNAISSAEEARKIAIEYRWWWGNKTVKIDIEDCPDNMNFEDWAKIWEQREFNNFINEYYEL